MPNQTSEEDKKHGDKLQSLPGKRSEAVDDDAPAARQDDDDEDEIDEDEDDDEIDEDIQPDDVEDPSAGGR